MNQFSRNLLLWLVLGLLFMLLFQIFSKPEEKEPERVYSEFSTALDRGEISEVTIQGKQISGRYKDGDSFRTYDPGDTDLVTRLREKDVKIEAQPEAGDPWYVVLLVQWFPMLLLIGVWIFFMRQMQVGGGKAMSFGKSRARLLNEAQEKNTFKDVAGVQEAKEELEEIIAFLKDPKKFTKLGGRIPKGVLLVGPPGTGKTLLARAIAGEAGVPFFSIAGSDFVEMFVGVGASRVRDLFVQGKKSAPCIIFIDEIDAVGRQRGAGLGGGHDEREQTLNQLLVEMDGFESNEGVILIAATNRADVLDPALLRPGRFDRRVMVPRPDVKGREGIIRVHMQRVPVADDVEVEVLAQGTPGFSGADLENLVNEAALLAARNDKEEVSQAEFELAKDKVMMGSERRSMIISDEEKKNTAYHESGHALVAMLLPETDPVHKVTIIPRGMALGLTQQLPEADRHTLSKHKLENDLAILFGGRAAEQLKLGHTTTGAGNDLERATDIARRMVCEWGMSEKLGPIRFGSSDENVFLGRDFAQTKGYSEATANLIDQEVRSLVVGGYERAKAILMANDLALEEMTRVLLEKEVLDRAELEAIVAEFASTSPEAPPGANL